MAFSVLQSLTPISEKTPENPRDGRDPLISHPFGRTTHNEFVQTLQIVNGRRSDGEMRPTTSEIFHRSAANRFPDEHYPPGCQ